MKKLYTILLAAIVVIMALPSCSSLSPMDKARQNMANTKLKELKKEGWKIEGSKTLEVALLDHYQKLEDDDAVEVIGEAITSSLNLGSRKALQSAQGKYAESASSYLKGSIENELSSEIKDGDAKEMERFYASYQSQVAKEITGQIKESFTIFRNIGKNQKGNDKYEVKVFCIVNEEAASMARQRALVNSARESDLASKYSSQFSNFAKEPVRY